LRVIFQPAAISVNEGDPSRDKNEEDIIVAEDLDEKMYSSIYSDM
jgi:hypothetical protein